MNKEAYKAGWILGTIIYVLFFQLFFTYKTIRKAVFNRRKKRAIKKADRIALEQGKRVYVVQIGRRFVVETRDELRRYNKSGRKAAKHLADTHLLDFDYRNAIVYTTQ